MVLVPAAGVAAQLHHQLVGFFLAVLAAFHIRDGLLQAMLLQNLSHAVGPRYMQKIDISIPSACVYTHIRSTEINTGELRKNPATTATFPKTQK